MNYSGAARAAPVGNKLFINEMHRELSEDAGSGRGRGRGTGEFQ